MGMILSVHSWFLGFLIKISPAITHNIFSAQV